MWRNPKNRYSCLQLFFDGEFIVFDTETTGLHADRGDRIIEIGACKMQVIDGILKEKDRLSILIRPLFPISEKIEKITGITNDMLYDEKTEKECFPIIYQFFGDRPSIAAYNTPFDLKFMQHLYQRNGKSFRPRVLADVLEMARDNVPYKDVSDYKLATIASLYGVDKGISFHRAVDDATATSLLLDLIHDEYLESEYVNGTVRPYIKACWLWDGYNHKQKRIIVRTNKAEFFYSVYYQHWGCKELIGEQKGNKVIKKDYPHFESVFDMEYIEKEVLAMLHKGSMAEARKMKPEEIEASIDLYRQERRGLCG